MPALLRLRLAALALASCAGTSAAAPIGHGAAVAPFTDEIAEGLAYFLDLAGTTRPKIVALVDAVTSGDLTEAKAAYVNSRAEYEQIEVLAPGFPDLDCRIDCRANAYEHGEAQSGDGSIPGDEFQGFHRIENYLFRDGVVEPAVPYAEGLLMLWDALIEALSNPSNFNFCGWFEGAIGLASEVAAKKVSSEEETYSDESILIYINNYIGIEQTALPFMDRLEAIDAAAAETLAAAFAAAKASVAPFIGAGGNTPYSEVGNGDRLSIQKAAYDVHFAMADTQQLLAAASSQTCGGGEEDEEPCVHPDPVAAVEARAIVADLWKALVAANKAQVDEFVELATSGASLDALKASYARGRPVYEQIEVLAPAFVDEDRAIDARPDGYDGGEHSIDFQGWHRLERMLFRDNITAGSNDFTSRGFAEWALLLQSTYAALSAKIDMLPGSLSSADLFDGVLGVLLEVAAKKISSEEETFSDLSLMIFHNNWMGAYSAILPFAEEAGMEPQLSEAYEAAVACIVPEHAAGAAPACLPMTTAADVTGSCVDALSGMAYSSYRTLDAATRECIVERGTALRAAVTAVAQALAVPHTCHIFHAHNVYDYRHAVLVLAPSGEARTTMFDDVGDEAGGIGSYGGYGEA